MLHLSKSKKITVSVILFLLINVALLATLSLISRGHYNNDFPVEQTNLLLVFWFLGVVLCSGLFLFSFYKFSGKGKEIIVSIVTFFFVLLISEIALRKFGYEPGRHTIVHYFHPVDSLYLLEGYEADTNGIFKVSQKAAAEIEYNIEKGITEYKINQVVEIYSLAHDNLKLINGEIENEISRYYKLLKQKNEIELTEFEKAVIHYIHSPINKDGFRSIAFKHYSNSKPKILLLGDSFTWGHSTTVKSNCFSDILLANGFVVYNTGISATDVAQYHAIAEKYIPVIKPDIIIVNFFLGNDIMYHKREIKPYTPISYHTNGGHLMADLLRTHFETPQKAYSFYLHIGEIPKNQNVINDLMAKTVVST